MNAAAVAVVVIGGVAAAVVVAGREDAAAASGNKTLKKIMDVMDKTINDTTGLNLLDWQKVTARPENENYVTLLHNAELTYGIPENLLVRLAYQESRFRADVITGKVVSSAGAQGIMQIVPRWHPNVNPLDSAAAINYAGRYLADLKRQFGTWELALQAYNWGPGNLRQYLNRQIASVPTETKNYSLEILTDIAYAKVTIA